jgi:hypothetical protein
MVGDSHRVLRLLPPLNIGEILLKVALRIKNQSINQSNDWKANTSNFSDDINIV